MLSRFFARDPAPPAWGRDTYRRNGSCGPIGIHPFSADDSVERMRTMNDSPSKPTPVAIVGAGPVGLSMALALARQGVRTTLLERKQTTSSASKAPGIHVRTREIFRQWQVEDRFLAAGELRQLVTLHSVEKGRGPLASFDFTELEAEADLPGLLILAQSETERLLLEALSESGLCDIRFGAEVFGLEQSTSRVALTYRRDGGEHSVDSAYVVGCDGANSFVREALGLPFAGTTYSLRPMLADVKITDDRDHVPDPRVSAGGRDFAFAVRLRPEHWRLVHLSRTAGESDEVPHEEVLGRVSHLLGSGPAEVIWASRFRIHVRSSPRFRLGRVMLAGDAAHVHSPASGFGMNGGIQDAHNLAWKLAYALSGGDADRLLDSYEVERRAVVVEDISRYTDRLTTIFMKSPAIARRAAWLFVRSMLRIPPFRRRSLRRTTMIDLDYPASPLLNRGDRAAGLRLPNALLHSPDGRPTRLYDILPGAPVMLHLAGSREGESDLPVREVIRIGNGGYGEPAGILRGLLGGEPGWILVRPDAHIAWARQNLNDIDEAVRLALGLQRTPSSTTIDNP
jgi:2-polyprenyl-6-methoxyphenol hydroxylase-like FAD-dependent oxidoreductase